MTTICQVVPTTEPPHFATLLVMALAPGEVGARIAQARARQGWTHQDLADRAGERLGRRVNLRTVQRWQKGVNPKTGDSWLPRLATLMELADLFGVPRSYFVDDESATPEGGLRDLRAGLAAVEQELRELRLALQQREAVPPPAPPTSVPRVRPS